MKTFRDLRVYCEPESVEPLMSQIETLLSDGWYRDRILESQMSPGYGEPLFYFVRSLIGEVPAVMLVMGPEPFGTKVFNIVPKGFDRIFPDQYNAILTEFYLRFLHPAASSSGLTAVLSSDELGIEESFGWKPVELLKAFSRAADKSTLQPCDLDRWLAFLIVLHRRPERSRASALLARWLLGEGWSRKHVDRLLDEWEFALDLLPEYDKHLLGEQRPSGSNAEFSRDDCGIIKAFGAGAAWLLKKFSILANQSIRHLLDDRRWYAFLISLHESGIGGQRAEHPLRDWLLKQGWSEEKAETLVSEWRFARELLSAYDTRAAKRPTPNILN